MEEKATKFSIHLVFSIFTFFVLLSSYIAYQTNILGGDLYPLQMNYTQSYLRYLYLYLITNLTFYIIFMILLKNKIKMKKSSFRKFLNFKFDESKTKQNYIHFLFLIINFFFLCTVSFTSLGTMIQGDNAPRLVELIYALLQPQYLVLLYIYYFADSKAYLYKINFIIFIFSIVLTGFTGYLLFFLPFIVHYLLKRIGMLRLIIFIIIGLPFLPLLRIYKHMLKYDITIHDMFERLDFAYILKFARVMIDRFNYTQNMMFISEKKAFFLELFNDKADIYNPLYQGYLGSFFHKIIFHVPVGNIHAQLQYMITGIADSNPFFPLFAYYLVDKDFGMIVLGYAIILSLLLYLIIESIQNNFYFEYLLFIILYLYLLGGGFWELMNFFQALILFIFILFSIKILMNKFKVEKYV